MGPKDVIRKTLDTSDFIIKTYVNDLSDADTAAGPGRGDAPDRAPARAPDRRRAGCSRRCVEPGSARPLPDGFHGGPRHQEAGEGRDSRFATKDEYLQALGRAARATKKALDQASATPTWTTTAAESCPRGRRPSASS